MTVATSSGRPLGRREWRSEKVQSWHLERLAVVYVRQSTPQQVLDHQESTRLQYGLAGRAQAWGWPAPRVLVIDDDLGKSATSTVGRVGFQRLVSEVSLDHVGLILGVEMSRLARSNTDWHQLLELCALFRTLIADLDGIYDPAQYNDRLLLGLKRPVAHCTSCSTSPCVLLTSSGCLRCQCLWRRVSGTAFPAVAPTHVADVEAGEGAAEGGAPAA
jgi:hypothetical protein